MNFFEHQDLARKNTRKLSILFIAAIAGVIATLYFLIVTALYAYTNIYSQKAVFIGWQPKLFYAIAIPVGVIIGFNSLRKSVELRAGGIQIALNMGGRPMNPDNPLEKRLQNVVVEVAIASGIPIPDVFVLESEYGINAFAAGLTAESAVITVTQGCLEYLDRDELQGVIAHEFSHILNGDMRLNIRMMGLVHGLFSIYLLGRYFLKGMGEISKIGVHLSLLIMWASFMLMTCGSIGLLFGRLIKSAISRQREFLADASAIQFTRSREGLASALYRIHQSSHRSFVHHPAAESASHMFFGDPFKQYLPLINPFHTHPPILERMRRLGVTPRMIARRKRQNNPEPQSSLSWQASEDIAFFQNSASTPQAEQKVQAEKVFSQIGTVGDRQLDFAKTLMQKLPDALKNNIMTTDGSIGVLFALLHHSADNQLTSLDHVKQSLSDDQFTLFEQSLTALESCDPQFHLPLIDLAVPALRHYAPNALAELLNQIQQLSQCNQGQNIQHIAIQIILQSRLKPYLADSK